MTASGAKPYSPIYNGAQGATSTGKSPAYSPTSNLRSAAGSAPSPMAQNQSPAYSPSSLNALGRPIPGNSSAYMIGISPAAAGMSGGRSPRHYQAQISSPEIGDGCSARVLMQGRRPGGSPSPAYNPISPSYQGGLAGGGAASNVGGITPQSMNQGPVGDASNNYTPLSPAYNPSKSKK